MAINFGRVAHTRARGGVGGEGGAEISVCIFRFRDIYIYICVCISLSAPVSLFLSLKFIPVPPSPGPPASLCCFSCSVEPSYLLSSEQSCVHVTARANGEGHGEPRIRNPAQRGALPGPPTIPGEAAGGSPLPLRSPPLSRGPLGWPRARRRHPRPGPHPSGVCPWLGDPRGRALGTANPPPPRRQPPLPLLSAAPTKTESFQSSKRFFGGCGARWSPPGPAPGAAGARPPLPFPSLPRARSRLKVIREGTEMDWARWGSIRNSSANSGYLNHTRGWSAFPTRRWGN